MLSGPRLLADVDVGSYPSPAAEGRLWKYCGSGCPSGVANDWPMIRLPITVPSELRSSDPSAWSCKPGNRPTATSASG